MPEVITNSTAGLHAELETESGSCLSISKFFILGKLSFRLLNLYSLAFYEYVYIHIVCRQRTHAKYFATENQKKKKKATSPPVSN